MQDEAFFKSYSKHLAYTVESLTDCDVEPIRYIGAIQGGGFLIACDLETLTIRAVSENLCHEFAKAPNELIGSQLNEVIKVNGVDAITPQLIDSLTRNNTLECVFNRINSGKYLVTFAVEAKILYLDIEVYTTQMIQQQYPIEDVKNLIGDLDRSVELDQLALRLATAVKTITNFDRVMIYQFDEEWHGHVIGEAKEPSLESFLHLRYPASDIPPQARQLYLETNFRMIIDISAEPVQVLTGAGIGRTEFDLKASALRAVSPIHVKYLMNMGVKASFSLPIRVAGRLWGLVACHNYSGPLHLSKPVRSACELVGQIASGKISDHIAARRAKVRNETLELTHRLLGKVAEGTSPINAFLEMREEMLKLTDSTGAFVKVGHQEIVLGEVPDRALIAKVEALLKRQDKLAVWKSECLLDDLQLDKTSPRAAGAFAIPFSLGFEDVLIWFRPEAIREVRWGGKPEKLETIQGTRLLPRSSFAAWSQTVQDHCRPWTAMDDECAQYLLFNFVQGIFSKAAVLSQANKELEKISKAKDEFIGQVSHELRTPLGVIIGWIDILKDHGSTDPQLTHAIEVIDRNAKLQINLINDLLDVSRIISGKLRINPQADTSIDWLLKEVVESLLPTAQAKGITLRRENSPPFSVTADPERLRQVVWNLIVNAIKFTPKNGEVVVSLKQQESYYQIVVADTGIGLAKDHLKAIFERFTQVGVKMPSQSGLGLGLSIVKALAELHGGRVEAHSEGVNQGAQFIVSLPVFALTEGESATETRLDRAAATKQLEGLNVLVVEDQRDAAEALAYLVTRNGALATIANDGRQAFSLLQKEKFDLLLSDINMPEMDGYELITKWRALEKDRQVPRMPAIALTAYASSKDRTLALSRGFDSHIPKPVDREELLAVLGTMNLAKAGSNA